MPHLIFLDAIVLTMTGEFTDTLLFGTEMSEVLHKPVYLIGISAQKRRVRV
jgi:hypothetical protein